MPSGGAGALLDDFELIPHLGAITSQPILGGLRHQYCRIRNFRYTRPKGLPSLRLATRIDDHVSAGFAGLHGRADRGELFGGQGLLREQ